MRLDEYTDKFSVDALRHEIRTFYDVPTDGDDFARFLRGAPGPRPDVVGPWGRWVAQQVRRGATVRRLRVLAEPPNDYLRFEMGWAYVANAAAGEDIRILDVIGRPRPEHTLDDEFWMLDARRIAVLHYDEQGRFDHADTVEGVAANQFVTAVDAAWAAAEPFAQWWACHPAFHGPVEARV